MDLNDLGYPKVELRDPPTGKYLELAELQKKHAVTTVHGMAAEFMAYVVGADYAPIRGEDGEEKTPARIPDPQAPLSDWRDWVQTAPSRLSLRLLNARNLMQGDAEEGDGDSGN